MSESRSSSEVTGIVAVGVGTDEAIELAKRACALVSRLLRSWARKNAACFCCSCCALLDVSLSDFSLNLDPLETPPLTKPVESSRPSDAARAVRPAEPQMPLSSRGLLAVVLPLLLLKPPPPRTDVAG